MGLRAGTLSAIAVSGDSMEPALRDGDEILVDCSAGALRDGIHVVRLEGNLLVKRIATGRPGLIVLLRDNQARSEERRGGQEGVSKCGSRWSRCIKKKNKIS